VSAKPRRASGPKKARAGIPAHIPLPKFITTSELLEARRLKAERPDLLWVDVIAKVVRTNQRTAAMTSP